jgi:sugar phosphate isomerase/epimerase
MLRLISQVLLLTFCSPVQLTHADDHPAPDAEALGWTLGVQAFSFYTETFFEGIDRISALGLHHVEAMPFGRLSPEHRNIATDHNMPEEYRVMVKAKLAEAGVAMSSYGVVPLPNDEVECRKVFDYAKDMGIKLIVSEPPADAIDLIAKLCDEYEIDVAIHNHPIPSAYWDPQTVYKAVSGKTKRLGACGDTSHWQRSGLNVVASLKLLEGRLKTFHFGEVDGEKAAEFSVKRGDLALDDPKFPSMILHVRGIPNVVYGSGPADMRAWLVEIDRQGIQAKLSIEAFFDRKPDEAQKLMVECIAYFNRIAKELRGK